MIKEERIITRNNLKQLCIDFDLYTLGTSGEYEEMLKSAVFEGHLTTEKIVEIAKNIKTEYFLIVNGVKQDFCFETKEEAINYARPHLNNETKIEVLTVETKIRVEKTQETIK